MRHTTLSSCSDFINDMIYVIAVESKTCFTSHIDKEIHTYSSLYQKISALSFVCKNTLAMHFQDLKDKNYSIEKCTHVLYFCMHTSILSVYYNYFDTNFKSMDT